MRKRGEKRKKGRVRVDEKREGRLRVRVVKRGTEMEHG